jgi:hypothetical protein
MHKLTQQHLIYLLYASAYTEESKEDTVTKSNTKSYLPKKWKGQSEEIYNSLHTEGLIKQVGRGRFSVTEEGAKALAKNLAFTDYKFDSVKGPKVLNALLDCIKRVVEESSQPSSFDEMSFEEFEQKFKELYIEKRKQQELKGVVAIYSKALCDDFSEKYNISPNKLKQYFELLKQTEKIFAVDEKGNELIQWVE